MSRALDDYYLNKEEPVKSCLMALRSIILNTDSQVTEAWKYRMPFFCYRGKMFCYLWIDKHTQRPYLGLVEGNKINHPNLEKGNRSRMKILRIDPEADIDIKSVNNVLTKALNLYKNGMIKVRKQR